MPTLSAMMAKPLSRQITRLEALASKQPLTQAQADAGKLVEKYIKHGHFERAMGVAATDKQALQIASGAARAQRYPTSYLAQMQALNMTTSSKLRKALLKFMNA